MRVVTASTGASPAAMEAAARLPLCPYCGAGDYRLLLEGVRDRLRFVPGHWSYYQCRQCGSAVLSPYPDAKDLASYYPPIYGFDLASKETSTLRRTIGRLENALFYRPMHRRQARAVLRQTGMRDGRGRRMLDVGCGRGLRLLAFRQAGIEVQGADFVEDCVDYVRDELGIGCVRSDISGLGEHFAPETFDLITAFFVVEHITDIRGGLARCFDLLKPGGWIAGGVPLVDSLQARLLGARWASATEAPRHLTIPSQRGLCDALEHCGYVRNAVRADSNLNCAGTLVLSLLPACAYGTQTSLGRILARTLAGLVTLAAVPFCLLESHMFGLPGNGLFFARKPVRAAGPP